MAVTQALCAKEFLYKNEVGYHVTPSGAVWFGAHGIELSALKSRPLTRPAWIGVNGGITSRVRSARP